MITYLYPDDAGGEPYIEIPLSDLRYFDDKDRLPTLTITDQTLNRQYLCWCYRIKGVEYWKICRITTTTRTVISGRNGDGDILSTIEEKAVEYPNGYASYNFNIELIFLYSYSILN
jgi:hypothetical protein